MTAARTQIGLLLFPRLTQLDLTGPYEVFARLPDTDVHLIWKDLEPVKSDVGLSIVPTETFVSCPDLDVICVPGGPGVNGLLNDETVLDFVRRQGAQARFVTSVCTGALVLGAAGLLQGYQATTHWASMDFLAAFGATAIEARTCTDRNRITGGGVTAGIDFGLRLAAELAGETVAQKIQLYLEYDPQPPFQSGSPKKAPPNVLSEFKAYSKAMIEERAEAVSRASTRARETTIGKNT